MRFSVIMPVTLSDYPGAATERRRKFIRAVDSFRLQLFTSAELIIVSDGCRESFKVYNELYSGCGGIKMVKLNKRNLFSGNVRNEGLKMASGEYVCYLDSDDCMGSNHLLNLDSELTRRKNPVWAYYDETIGLGLSSYGKKTVKPEYLKIGTSSIVHKNGAADWKGCDGYGHDWIFAQRLMKAAKGVKINNAEYYICHFSGMFADEKGNVKKMSIDV
jgi:glycosyltransferase involved in cell wall biosynthesis